MALIDRELFAGVEAEDPSEERIGRPLRCRQPTGEIVYTCIHSVSRWRYDMVRIQILLGEEQCRELKAAGQSLSALIQDCVDARLAVVEDDPLLDLGGSIPATSDRAPEDLAERHDAYLV